MSKFATRFQPAKSAGIDFTNEPSLVAVEFAQEADINFLLKRYKATGSLYSVEEMAKAKAKPMFGDFAGIPDYQETLNKVNSALEQFESLPLNIRQRFHDDPMEMLAFLQDEDNRKEAEDLGIVQKAQPAKPVEQTEPEANKPEPQA